LTNETFKAWPKDSVEKDVVVDRLPIGLTANRRI